MFTKSKSKGGMCDYCTVVTIVLAVVVGLATIVSLIGVYKAHVYTDSFSFGTTSASLSLIALAINLFLIKKLASSCPCQCQLPMSKK